MTNVNTAPTLIRSCCYGKSYLKEIGECLPSVEDLAEVTFIFKALSDPTRAKIIFALLNYEICVGEMASLLQLPQSHVSHQLIVLKKYGIVTFTKHKKMSFYRIKNNHVRTLVVETLQQVKS